MTPEAERIIRESWMRLVPIRLQAADLFYQRLFAIDPSSQALFDGKPMHVQHEKFLQTVDWLVQMLDYPPQIIEALQELAKRHVDYGVVLPQYDTVGDALLWALEQGLGDGWTPETKRAWVELYTFIAGVMKRAVASVN